MKPRQREINIFNLSMMDVISGALGAVLIIVIILLPYYKKDLVTENQQLQEKLQAAENARRQAEEETQRLETLRKQAEQAQRQAELAQQRAREAQQQAEEAREQAEQAKQQAHLELQETQKILKTVKEKLAKTFLVVVIKWKTVLQDVDLHIVDPSGAEFFYQRKTVPGRPGELSEDDQFGPGNEVWEIRAAPPGDYRVLYNLYDRHKNPGNPVVTGRVFYRDGSTTMPDTSLSREKQKKAVAIIRVKENGGVEIR